MAEKKYTNREIDLMNKDIHEKLDLILLQTTKHNGRLTNIERWMWGVSGAVVIISWLMANKLLAV